MERKGPPKHRWPAEVFTDSFVFKGKLEPFGLLLDTLNDVRRDCMVISEAVAIPLEAGNPMDSFTMPEMTLSVSGMSFVALTSEEDRKSIALMPNKQYIIAYTSRFVLRAEFRMGGDMNPRDMMDTFTNNFLPVRDATLFPLFAPKSALSLKHPLLLVNKKQIISYHVELR